MFIILLCLLLGLAMLYLGFSQGMEGPLVFGGILLAGAFLWMYQTVLGHKQNSFEQKEKNETDLRHSQKKRKN